MSAEETEGDGISERSRETESDFTTETTESDFTTETTESDFTTETTDSDFTTETTDSPLTTETNETSEDASILLSANDAHLEGENYPNIFHLPKDLISLEGRHIKSEDFEWGISPVLPLADIIVEAAVDVESSDIENLLKNATHDQRHRILALLPLDLPLEVTLPILDDGIYWKRLCLKFWPAWDVWRYSDNWKCMFIHRSVQELIERFNPEKDSIHNLLKNIEIYSAYVTSLKICKLVKCVPENIEIDVHSENFDEKLDDVIIAPKIPIYLDFEKIFGCIQNLKRLTIALSPSCIDFENFHFNIADFNCLLRAMKKLKKLENLRLSNRNFSNEQMSKILQMLSMHKALKELNLSFNFIDDTTCYFIAKLLLSNPLLENLNLMYNKINDSGAKIIVSALYADSKLKKLDLSLNMIGDDGAATIAKVLLKNETLLDLDLSKNKITEEGGIAFAELVRKSRTLRRLKLQENFLGEKAGREFSNAIKENDCLLEFEVRFCGLRSEDEGVIHRAILQNWSKVPVKTEEKDSKVASEFLF